MQVYATHLVTKTKNQIKMFCSKNCHGLIARGSFLYFVRTMQDYKEKAAQKGGY